MEFTTVDTSTTDYATGDPPQRSTFTGANRQWVFYSNGTNIVYSSRETGYSGDWDESTTFDSGDDWNFSSIWWDSTKVHVTWVTADASNTDVFYRSGTPSSNGTIGWDTKYIAVSGESGKYKNYVSICLDSDNYPVIGYTYYPDPTYHTSWVTIATSTDGSTWEEPYKLDSYATGAVSMPVVLPLSSSRKILAIYSYDATALRSRYYDGSSWGDIVTVVDYFTNWNVHSSVSFGDSVFCAYSDAPNLYYKLWSEDSWSLSQEISNGVSLSITKRNNGVIVFTSVGDSFISYCDIDFVTGVGSLETLTSGIADYVSASISSDYEASSGYASVVWTDGAGSPYDVSHVVHLYDEWEVSSPQIYSPTSTSGYWTFPTHAYLSNDKCAHKDMSSSKDTNSPTSTSGTAWTSPTNAYSDDEFCAAIMSGDPSDNNLWYDYGFTNDSTVSGVRVRLDAWHHTLPSSDTYYSPTGYDTGNWTDVGYGYDENTSTYAYDSIGSKNTWSAYQDFTRSTVTDCIGVRAWIVDSSSKLATVEIDVYYSSAWHNIYSGLPAFGQWVTFPIGSTQDVSKMRFRGLQSGAGGPCEIRLHEADFIVTEYNSPPQIKMAVSWDEGNAWSSEYSQTVTDSETTYWFDVTSETVWTPTKLNDTNFRVKVWSQTVDGSVETRLDWVPVEISYVENNFWQTYYYYNISSFSGYPIGKVELGIEAYAASGDKIQLEVTSDGGDTWSTSQTSDALGSSDPNVVTWFDFTSHTSWDDTKLNDDNFKVKATYVGVNDELVYLDWIPVRISYIISTLITKIVGRFRQIHIL